jgi:hypothetical protein
MQAVSTEGFAATCFLSQMNCFLLQMPMVHRKNFQLTNIDLSARKTGFNYRL